MIEKEIFIHNELLLKISTLVDFQIILLKFLEYNPAVKRFKVTPSFQSSMSVIGITFAIRYYQ